MASFKDAIGREWEIKFDAPKLNRIRTECEVDLTAMDGKDFERVADDPFLLVNTLWFVLKPQAVLAGVTEEQFAEGLVGEFIDRAVECLLKAITDFFNPSKSALLQAIAEENSALRELATAQAMAKVKDPKIRARVMEAIETRMDDEVTRVLMRLSSATSTPDSLD
jgi:hypothetical protein